MTQSLEILTALEYPGRLILLGTNAAATCSILVYGITGRSASSQARKLVLAEDGIWVRPTDEKTLKEGNVDLLVYPAVLFDRAGLAVSNGKQTESIRRELGAQGLPVSTLSSALERWDYEPDAPIYTPRICGCVLAKKSALSVIRRGDAGESLKSYFEIPPTPGLIRMISTYAGPNRDPLPSFTGEPRSSMSIEDSATETAEAVYESLCSAGPERDFRVAVVCVFASFDNPTDREVHIINRHERTG